MRILFFGKLQDLAGGSEISLEMEEKQLNLTAVLERLSENSELVAALQAPTTLVSVNQELIPKGSNPLLGKQDEVAFMPPLSGG